MNDFEKSMRTLLKNKTEESSKRKIVFVEGWSNRMQSAVNTLEADQLVDTVSIFETKSQFDGASNKPKNYIIIEEDAELYNELVEKYVEIRKGKETKEQAEANLKTAPFFSAMMLATGKVHGAIGGVHFATGDILKAAFKSIGPKAGIKTISSVMIVNKEKDWSIFTDISVNPNPNEDQLVEIAKNACDFCDFVNFDKKVAFLSFSTTGSGKTPEAIKMANVTQKFNELHKMEYPAIGEIQFDAAYDENIRKAKYKTGTPFSGRPSVFVFPDLNAGNIGYKIAQRMGGWGAVGPMITGLKKPFNDLSRGATIEDIVNTVVITALQGFEKGEN